MTDPIARIALITGAARGIGLAASRRFLAEGWHVAMLDVERETLASAITGLDAPGHTLALPCDLSDPAQITAAFAALTARFGRLDALVNNAGIAVFKPILNTTLEDWNRVMAVNLTAPFLCTQAAAVLLRETGGGAVVNIASISGLRASTMRVAYGTSKGAIIHLTKQQAIELGAAGIRVNCVAPGPVDTEMAKLVHTVAIRSDYHDTIPLNRYGTMQEIANAVGFLCSPAASYVNGQTLAVDGGFEASGVGLPTLRAGGLQQRG
jgi:NAD(P)-dependent dehydrogenase (short-subunit alcohol dehydrogenase family)